MSTPRFVCDGDAVLDTETGLRAWFSDIEAAQTAADWMNTGNANIDDYLWAGEAS